MSIFLKDDFLFFNEQESLDDLEVASYKILYEETSIFNSLEKDLIIINGEASLNNISYLDESVKETLIKWWEKFLEGLKFVGRKISEWWNKFLNLFRKKVANDKKNSKPLNEYSKEKEDCSINLDPNSFKAISNYKFNNYIKDFGDSETKSHIVNFDVERLGAAINAPNTDKAMAEFTLKGRELLEKDEIFKPEIMKSNLEKKFYINSNNIKYSKFDANSIVISSPVVISFLTSLKAISEKHHKYVINASEKQLAGEKSDSLDLGKETSKATIIFTERLSRVEQTYFRQIFDIVKRIESFASTFRGK